MRRGNAERERWSFWELTTVEISVYPLSFLVFFRIHLKSRQILNIVENVNYKVQRGINKINQSENAINKYRPVPQGSS